MDVSIGVKMIDPGGVEGTGTADDAVNLITFLQQKIGEITPVLTGDPGNQRFRHLENSRFSSGSASEQQMSGLFETPDIHRPTPTLCPDAQRPMKASNAGRSLNSQLTLRWTNHDS